MPRRASRPFKRKCSGHLRFVFQTPRTHAYFTLQGTVVSP